LSFSEIAHQWPLSTVSYHQRGVERIKIFAIGISAVAKTLSLGIKLTLVDHEQS
jgi:hypothetical protein